MGNDRGKKSEDYEFESPNINGTRNVIALGGPRWIFGLLPYHAKSFINLCCFATSRRVAGRPTRVVLIAQYKNVAVSKMPILL
jgi:hypothetical protein